MKTSNGLTVPERYGSGGTLKGASHPPRRNTREAPARTIPARDVTDGMKLRGHATMSTFEVLAVERDKEITITVINSKGDVRRWVRRPGAPVELA